MRKSQFMNKRNLSHDQKKNQQIQSLLNAIDVSSIGGNG